jgi:hypothetical protein
VSWKCNSPRLKQQSGGERSRIAQTPCRGWVHPWRRRTALAGSNDERGAYHQWSCGTLSFLTIFGAWEPLPGMGNPCLGAWGGKKDHPSVFSDPAIMQTSSMARLVSQVARSDVVPRGRGCRLRGGQSRRSDGMAASFLMSWWCQSSASESRKLTTRPVCCRCPSPC